MVDGVLFQPNSPMCHHNTFDFFVVHRSIAHAVVGVLRMDGVGVKPHHPVRLVRWGDARRFAVRQLVRAKTIPAIMPHGPFLQPPSYDDITQNLGGTQPILQGINREALHSQTVNNAMCTWYRLAREELSDLMSEDVKFRDAKFKWARAVKAVARP